MAEDIRPLMIGLIGYNMEQTEYGLWVLSNENSDQVDCVERHRIKFNDGTEIRAIYNENSACGRRFDQIILFDDEKWNIYEKRRDLIEYVFWHMANYSCVPEEYIVMKLEY